MKYSPLLFSLFLLTSHVYAEEIDEDFADSLKIEANHNMSRIKSFRDEVRNNKIFDVEREKGLGEFLEEQEKWELIRDRGLREYRTQKRQSSPREGGLEHDEYLEQKESEDALYERSRQVHVRTRNRVMNLTLENLSSLEMSELGLDLYRPRYELRKRANNKWVGTGTSGSKSGFSNGSASYQAPPPPPMDIPPPPEFPAAPAPYEGYDDQIQPAPVPSYDPSSGVPYDPSFGAENVPPPPPPPPDFDF